MGLGFLLQQPFAQHALVAAALVAVSCGLIGPFVVTRGMAFAVHGTAELAFTGAAAGLLVANNPVVGALIGSVVVAGLIAVFGARQRERDSAIGVILAFGMGIGVLLLGFYQGFATAATNILFGNIFGVSGSQLIVLLVIGVIVVTVMGIWYRPLLFASVDPEAAEARGVAAGVPRLARAGASGPTAGRASIAAGARWPTCNWLRRGRRRRSTPGSRPAAAGANRCQLSRDNLCCIDVYDLTG